MSISSRIVDVVVVSTNLLQLYTNDTPRYKYKLYLYSDYFKRSQICFAYVIDFTIHPLTMV
jgi:hypothetical protein